MGGVLPPSSALPLSTQRPLFLPFCSTPILGVIFERESGSHAHGCADQKRLWKELPLTSLYSSSTDDAGPGEPQMAVESKLDFHHGMQMNLAPVGSFGLHGEPVNIRFALVLTQTQLSIRCSKNRPHPALLEVHNQ
jgi:hypothetical protein